MTDADAATTSDTTPTATPVSGPDTTAPQSIACATATGQKGGPSMDDSRARGIQARLDDIRTSALEASELAAEIAGELPDAHPLGFYFKSLARQARDWNSDANHFIARWNER